MKGIKYAAGKIKNKFNDRKPVKVEVKKKKSLTTTPTGRVINERSKKNMGGATQAQIRKVSEQTPRKDKDLKDFIRVQTSRNRSALEQRTDYNRGGKISSYYKKGGNVITGR